MEFGPFKIFLMLFLVLGPIKILVPFQDLTQRFDLAMRRRIARRAILFSAAALLVAGLLGRTMLENFGISLPVLALTGGTQALVQEFITHAADIAILHGLARRDGVPLDTMILRLGSVDIHLEFMTAAARWMMALKLWSVLSERMAIRLNSLSLQKKFSIR